MLLKTQSQLDLVHVKELVKLLDIMLSRIHLLAAKEAMDKFNLKLALRYLKSSSREAKLEGLGIVTEILQAIMQPNAVCNSQTGLVTLLTATKMR